MTLLTTTGWAPSDVDRRWRDGRVRCDPWRIRPPHCFHDAVGQPQPRLVDLDGVEVVGDAFNRRIAARESNQGMVNAGVRRVIQENAGPVSACAGPGTITRRVEHAAAAVAVVD